MVEDRIVIIGDIHGEAAHLNSLWKNLQTHLGAELDSALVVFLGDYVDRGPNSRDVINKLIEIEGSRQPGRTRFVMGNHDFGMAAYLGLIEAPPGFDLDSTKLHYKSGYFLPKVEGGMHYIGRRWGGSSIYQAQDTFRSYNVAWASTLKARENFIKAVPQSHKDFLRRVDWICDVPVSWAPGRFIAVHAGLLAAAPTAPQIKSLAARELDSPAIQATLGRIDAFCERDSVWPLPADLVGQCVVASGHHGTLHVEGDRIILDNSPLGHLDAMVLPERVIVRHSKR